MQSGHFGKRTAPNPATRDVARPDILERPVTFIVESFFPSGGDLATGPSFHRDLTPAAGVTTSPRSRV
jgi:hypothetical protein